MREIKKIKLISSGILILFLFGFLREAHAQISQYLMNQADSSIVLHYQNLGYTGGLNAIVEYSTGPGGEEIDVPADLYILNNADTNNQIGASHHLNEITEEMVEIAGQNPDQHLLLYDSANFTNQEEYFIEIRNDIDSLLLITGRINKPSKIEEGIKAKMKVFPNPSGNELNLKLQILDDAYVTMYVYNHLAQQVGNIARNLKLRKGEFDFKLNQTDLPEGINFVKVAIKYLDGKKENLTAKIICYK